MLRRRIHFVATVLLLFLLSWVDVFFFGTERNLLFPNYANQAIHIVVLAAAGVIGHQYWQKGWVRSLWDGLYMLVFITVVLASITFLLLGHHAHQWKQIISQLRNNFEGPLPFLVLYLFSLVGGQFTSNSK